MKRCSGCDSVKELAMFTKNKSEKDGLQRHCKSCQSKHYRKNRETVLKRLRERHDPVAKSAYDKARRMAKGDALRAYDKLRARLPHRIELQHKTTATRRARIKQRLAPWFGELDEFVLKEAYNLAAKRREVTGVQWQLDHIEPLSGKDVCGLHVSHNLQVIPAKQNMFFKNKRKQPSVAGL